MGDPKNVGYSLFPTKRQALFKLNYILCMDYFLDCCRVEDDPKHACLLKMPSFKPTPE